MHCMGCLRGISSIKTLPLRGYSNWMGRRAFRWVWSVVIPNMHARLERLSCSMAQFYSMPTTRSAYQEMLDLHTNAQPETEKALRRAVLSAKPSAVLEVGCGSGRIYARLRDEGLTSGYTGVEMSSEIIGAVTTKAPIRLFLAVVDVQLGICLLGRMMRFERFMSKVLELLSLCALGARTARRCSHVRCILEGPHFRGA